MVYRETALEPCPSCGHALHPLSLRGFDLARCMECGGVWVDERTLEELWRWAGMPSRPLPLHSRDPRARPGLAAHVRDGARRRREGMTAKPPSGDPCGRSRR